MAASTSSSSSIDQQKSFKYDVFLSFRGTDTRNNFIDHLYQALQDKGIYTYKDDERITKGQRISDELLKSIEDSRFYIVVFSKNYASSSWCLEELVKIMEECQKTKTHTAYPVFYDVEPTEVRKQTGEVGKAFSKHENHEDSGKWRIALKEASDLAGWELKNTANGSEARFIQKVIEDISKELYTINFSFDKNLVGIEKRVNDIVSSLEIGVDDVRMIGIKGMGGVGKTTLARAVFDQISIRFDGKSFVENVREVTSNPSFGLKSLQQQILSDVLNDKDIRVSGVRDGQNILKRRMRGRKVLIALDDVDNLQQLEALAGDLEWFKSGSRIIITTRDEQVLLTHRVTLIRDVNLLSNEEAICLFSKYAFGHEGPVQEYEELSKQVVSYASGLPLTIKVLGSLLFRKDKPEWEDALQRLDKIPVKETLKILELSYTVLEDDHKEIFLDVACIMKGWEKDKAIKALESCGFHAKIGLRVLQQKSLITIYKHDFVGECVGMHDHIEEMGRNIVRRLHPHMPHKHSRLWKNDEIEHILANDMGTEETRCIRFSVDKGDPYAFIKGLGKMKTLRYLDVLIGYGCKSLEFNTFIPSLPDALGYLCITNYPFKSLPKTFQSNNLVTLEMPGSEVLQLWEGGEHKVLNKLRFLDLSWSKLRTLNLQLAPNLETVNLAGCRDLLLEKLPEDLCRLGRLEKLNLSYTDIKHIPDGICMLKYLRSLELDGCMLLEKLPEDIGHLDCLENLYLLSTKIKYLPDSICKLKHLNSLRLGDCLLLEKLPDDIYELECLKRLGLSSTNIRHLPDSICKLKHLTYLSLRGCLLLEKLPEDLGDLECLESLDLSSTKIKHLPDCIYKLKHLTYLSLGECLLLEKLHEDLGELECLKDLDLSCTNIKHLPDGICKLKHLRSLFLRECMLLEKLPEDLGNLESLGCLDLSSTKIKHLPDSICKLKYLKSLHLEKCLLLEKLPEDLGHLECLEDLYLRSTKIKHLPDSICMLKQLKNLDIDECLFLEKLPADVGRLECLKVLDMRGTSISHLPQGIRLLKGLKIYGPRRLIDMSVGFTSLLKTFEVHYDVCHIEV